MPKLTIDGREVEVEAGTSILQAAEVLGIEIPRFCYHERLAIAGNCRMCMVEVANSPKPVASCAMPVADGMVVRTNTPVVAKARKGALEFLLINHPLDCPICDQGGECDLQDETMAYGYDRGRFAENKRAVQDKNFGPLVKTTMNRCIHCTRCIRFITEVAGVPELGATGRGENMEVTTYVEKALSSELSGNIIDLCPVGALTSKPYAYTARSWELKKTESIDVLDAVGAAIRIDSRGNQVMRILPRLNDDVNEEWLSDKSRFACDALVRQRLDRPYVRRDGKLREATWNEAFTAISERLKATSGARIAAIAGDLADAESMLALKELFTALGSVHLDGRQDGVKLAGPRGSYIFNSGIAGIDRADVLLLIGTDPRKEAPVLNARIRKRWLKGGFSVAAVGPKADLTYRHDNLGDDPAILAAIAKGEHPFADKLKAAKNPMLIIGQGALTRTDGAILLGLARKIAETGGMVRDDWNGFNVLHTAAARVGALDLGFLPGIGGRDVEGILAGAEKGDIDLVYLLGADEIDMARLGRAFVVYQGHHGDAGAHRADVILPGAAYTEKNATYVNTEGRVQRTRLAVFPPGDAKEDWTIVRALSEVVGHKLSFDTLEQLRLHLSAVSPSFATLDRLQTVDWGAFGAEGTPASDPLVSPIENYYMTDSISRASKTMAECTATFVGCAHQRSGTHG
ncbi:NADH-quinone oxidoreductase subunit NuoG [Telmatospirillum siberiense]|uniref:NADH-quinone oxidoreductase n=1 Tax=Telmatospirillum siberiense TaxID=382514 RepID=A0A2N3PZJ6_9PROT|nr:NADH-quinone oxidoreductase subunit NuoG [Telmatospirillum siberiense]PKU25837.1 NADH-quinone oxidoreductase subunit G [Telmatospirillum siberiense]